jgi:hypothetical protein
MVRELAAMDDLKQTEADRLFNLEKRKASDEEVDWPLGAKVAVQLISLDGREEFILDVSTYSIKVSKITMQNRVRTTAILARLDIDGPTHRNPDDVEIPCPHIHLYREGFNDKWAFPVQGIQFRDLSNRVNTLEDFMRYCNITDPPSFRFGLF